MLVVEVRDEFPKTELKMLVDEVRDEFHQTASKILVQKESKMPVNELRDESLSANDEGKKEKS